MLLLLMRRVSITRRRLIFIQLPRTTRHKSRNRTLHLMKLINLRHTRNRKMRNLIPRHTRSMRLRLRLRSRVLLALQERRDSTEST